MGGDDFKIDFCYIIKISIHTTRVGGDPNEFMTTADFLEFQSTPPVWVVTEATVTISNIQIISIHTTRVGGDSKI